MYYEDIGVVVTFRIYWYLLVQIYSCLILLISGSCQGELHGPNRVPDLITYLCLYSHL